MSELVANRSGVQLTDEVEEALRSGNAIIALESTVIAHGLPYPQNLETAVALEETVRAAGAVPATIAVLHGIPHAGLSPQELQLLATNDDIQKLSRRDLAIALTRSANGATTVASTMILAARAGIRVFATARSHNKSSPEVSSVSWRFPPQISRTTESAPNRKSGSGRA